jgi:DeoR/GlpR family transcriptional regulator of sugar metabolism
MHASGAYTVTDLADLFNVSRPTVNRTLRSGSEATSTRGQT